MVERCCALAKLFAERLGQLQGVRILNEIVYNQVLVDFGDATKAVIEAVQEEGTMWAGVTVWQSHTAMRISVCSWATTKADVEFCLEKIEKIYMATKQ